MKNSIPVMLLITASAALSNAATLVHYQFTHTGGLTPDPTPLTSTTVAANMTATSVGNTTGQQDSTTNRLRISDGSPIIWNPPGNTGAYSSTNDFVTFRLDANAGYYFDLTTVSIPLVQFQLGRISGANPIYSQLQIWGATSGTATAGSTLLYTSGEISATTSTMVTMSDTAGIAAVDGTNKYTSLYFQVQRRASATGTSVYI